MTTKKDLQQQLAVAEARILDLEEELESQTKFEGAILSKRGYLYLWKDRALTAWGGTKWSIRFVSLERGKLSYSTHASSPSPEYVLTLRGCAVRDEGIKHNKRDATKDFNMFSIYQRSDDEEEEDDDVVPLLRFSTPSLAEKNLWMTVQ